ncbi:hypothetical protein GQ43DRAFT_437933 [Delitschia confertaspora ATCC 74209]|uniref:Uncharacterized protein n=1 Tax=Delitschia confertaspora ATCC 74209 TaxID=1513339 RepID=A0A9P4JSM8_9PLEO|nr:hypothetical protein GQ43DRAFT_437933 [Delitschia confertaspora ATCC 74209]
MDVASAAAVLTAVTDLAISTLAVAVSNTSSKDNFGAVSTHTLTSTGTVTGPVDAQGKATADPIAIADNGREGIKSCYDCDQVYQRCINMSNIAFSHSPAQSE